MELIIGRDAASSQLKIVINGQSKLFGSAGSVPLSVSRSHCSLSVSDAGLLTLKNLNPANSTFVNGVSVQTKLVHYGDKITLGPNHYSLQWSVLQPFLPSTSDIRPLKKVWDDYQTECLKAKISDRRFGVIRSVTGILMPVVVVLGLLTGRDNPQLLFLYGAMIVVSIALFVMALIKSSKVPKEEQQRIKRFHQSYVCPHCQRFLGNTDYDIIRRYETCPYCKTKFQK